MSNSAVTPLVEAWRALGNRPALVVTGAGVSLASGLPTFRGTDPGAVWANDIMEKGTYAYFRRQPVESWTWYLSRFGSLRGARPNPAHDSLAALERYHVERDGMFLLVTQNVDGLHRAAGSSSLIEVHGRADRVRCSGDDCDHGAPRGSLPIDDAVFDAFRAAPGPDTLPRCPACRAVLRPHVLWFDEYYTEHADYQFARVAAMAEAAELVLFAGTSFSVGVTDLILSRARSRRVPIFSIDPAGTPEHAVTIIGAPAEDALAALVAALA